MTNRTLHLSRESLADIDATELRAVVGAAHTLLECVEYPTDPTCLVTDLTDRPCRA